MQDLTVYMHQTHRLGLVGDKTKIIDSKQFIQEELNNQYQLEKLDILHEIEVINPYTFQVDDIVKSSGADIGDRLVDAVKRILKFENLDLGVARAIIRRARAHRIPDIAILLLDNCEFFRPVINDVVLYLDVILSDNSSSPIIAVLVDLERQRVFDSKSSNEWFSWLISKHALLAKNHNLRRVISTNGRITYLARAAVCTGNLAWVRGYKDSLLNHAAWNRRAILYAAQLMSTDEKSSWLKPLKGHAAISLLEKWMIQWVLAETPIAEPLPEPQIFNWPFDDETGIPF